MPFGVSIPPYRSPLPLSGPAAAAATGMVAFVPALPLRASAVHGAAVRRAPAPVRAVTPRMSIAEVDVYFPNEKRHEGAFVGAMVVWLLGRVAAGRSCWVATRHVVRRLKASVGGGREAVTPGGASGVGVLSVWLATLDAALIVIRGTEASAASRLLASASMLLSPATSLGGGGA